MLLESSAAYASRFEIVVGFVDADVAVLVSDDGYFFVVVDSRHVGGLPYNAVYKYYVCCFVIEK